MLVELSGIWLVLLNAVAWVAIHLGVAYLCWRIPLERLGHWRWLFRTRGWERGGAVYQATKVGLETLATVKVAERRDPAQQGFDQSVKGWPLLHPVPLVLETCGG